MARTEQRAVAAFFDSESSCPARSFVVVEEEARLRGVIVARGEPRHPSRGGDGLVRQVLEQRYTDRRRSLSGTEAGSGGAASIVGEAAHEAGNVDLDEATPVDHPNQDGRDEWKPPPVGPLHPEDR